MKFRDMLKKMAPTKQSIFLSSATTVGRQTRESRKVLEPIQYFLQLTVIAQYFYYPLTESERFLCDHYVKKKLSTSKIAEISGYSKSTLLRALKELGITSRKMNYLVREGLKGGGRLPYGKKLRHGKLVPHVFEQKVIDDMKELKVVGLLVSPK